MRRLWLIILILLGSLTTTAQAAWYISTTAAQTGSAACSDSAAGTRAAPFCTMERAKTAMAGSGDHTTYFRQGTYTRTTQYTFNSNETWEGDPADPAHSAIINTTGVSANRAFSCNACNTVAMRNLRFQGTNTGVDGMIFLENFAHHLWIENNQFVGPANTYEFTSVVLYNTSFTYVRGNAWLGPSAGEPLRHFMQGGAYQEIYMTDNTFTDCERWCIENITTPSTGVSVSGYYVDRNTFTNFAGPQGFCGDAIPDHYSGALSFGGNMADTTAWITNGTVWGNTFNFLTNYNGCKWAIELILAGVTVSQNTFNWPGASIAMGRNRGTVIENNTHTMVTSGSAEGECGGRGCAHRGTSTTGNEWIGLNVMNGVTKDGCDNLYCSNSGIGWKTYSAGSKPTTWSPSAPFTTASAPTVPGSLAVSSPTVSTANATWTASTDADGDLSGYRVYACFPSGSCTRALHMTLSLGTSGTILGLRGGVTYSLALRAVDAGGLESGDSNVVTVTTSAIPSTNPELLLTYESGSGSAIFDSSGHAHNSTSFTGTFSATAHDGSFSGAFSGTQVSRIPRTYTGESPVGLEPTAVTIASWIRRNGAQGTFTNIVNKTWQSNNPNTYTSYKLLLNPDYGTPDTSVVECEIGQTGTYILAASATGAIPDVTWIHVACTYDPAAGSPQLKLYVSGTLVASATSTVAILYDATTTGDLWLADNGAGGQRYIGNLDETRIYRNALTLAEVQALAGVTGDGMPPAAPTNLRVIGP